MPGMTGFTVWEIAALAGAALGGATLAAISGFGGAAVLLPVLVAVFGVRDAVPILTVAQLVGNASRVWFNRHAVDGRVVVRFAAGGIPAGVAGSILFARAPLHVLTRLLGAFLIFIVARRCLRHRRPWKPSLRAFALIGAVSAFVSALVGSTGPLMAPLFLDYGLVKGAYIGTEALATVTMHTTKLIVYRQASVLSSTAIVDGLALAPLMIVGTWIGKRVVDRVSPDAFVVVIEITMMVAGVLFLARG